MASSKFAVTSSKILVSSISLSPLLRTTISKNSQFRNISTQLFTFKVNPKFKFHTSQSKRYFASDAQKPDDKEKSTVESTLSSLIDLRKFNAKSNYDSKYYLGGGAILLISSLLLFTSVTVIPAGHIGLLDLFGNVSERTLTSGLHLKNPLAKVRKFSLQTRIEQANTEVPSKEGLLVLLECALQYHLNPSQVRELYISVGKNYADVLLRPQFWSAIRQVTSSYDAKALYTSESRARMSVEIKEHLNSILLPRGIVVEDAPLKKIVLPPKLASSIELKLSAEQDSQRMEFVLQKEELEAKRKAIEAKGISEFQKIVSEGVSEPLLRWKGIEATEKLAESPNAKVIVIGGSDGLPIILNTSEKKIKASK